MIGSLPRRALFAGAVCLMWLLATAGARANEIGPAYLVIDPATGAEFAAQDADRRRYPASLTKLMTLYLTFDALRAGTLSWETPLTVSAHAAGQPPSRLSLKRGQTLTVQEAVDAVIIRSANDAAVVLAEARGDSEIDFALKMTHRARQMDMSRTVFRNASGLPHPGARTTARDLSKLAGRLIADFPEYYDLFGRTGAQINGHWYRSTNRLLSTFAGADGLKTGYTDAARFNLAFSAVRGRTRLIAVVLGYPSAASRDKQVAGLMETAFAKLTAPVPHPRPKPMELAMAAAAPLTEPRPRQPPHSAGADFTAASSAPSSGSDTADRRD